MENYVSFGHWIKQRRKQLKLTQQEISEKVGCSISTIQKIEADARRPSKEAAERLAMVLKIASQDYAAFVNIARRKRAVDNLQVIRFGIDDAQLNLQLPLKRHNLPVPITSLIGRQDDVLAVCSQLRRSDVRLLNLTGPGGIGKTRLALEVAAKLSDEFPDGMWFIELAPITDPALVVSTIASKIGIKEVGGQLLLERLAAFMRDKHLFLLLDNFEQVVAAAPLVVQLLKAVSGLKILVTSRFVLNIYGEQEYPVPPLDLPNRTHLPELVALSQYAGIALFLERTRAVNPNFQLTSANAAAVADICARLDGLPFAIELAAGWTRIFPPQALLKRLDQSLKTSVGDVHDLPVRLQTLHNAIDWSFNLLDRDERTLFARLGVFVGGCTIEAAEAVCFREGVRNKEPGDIEKRTISLSSNTQSSTLVLDRLVSLVGKNLVRRTENAEGEPRFMLLETIREYALEQLEASDEIELLRREHAAYFLKFAEDADKFWSQSQLRIWVTQFEEEYDNIRVALQWSLKCKDLEIGLRLVGAVNKFWMRRSHNEEARFWIESALARVDDETLQLSALYTRILSIAGIWAHRNGEIDQGDRLFEESLSLYRKLQDQNSIGQVLVDWGRGFRDRGDYPRAKQLLEEGLDLLRVAGSQNDISWALQSLGDAALDQGDVVKAQTLFEEALKITRQKQDTLGTAWSLVNLGRIKHAEGDYKRAAALLEEGRILFQELGADGGVAVVLIDQADVARAQGEIEQAIELYQESLTFRHHLHSYSFGYDARCLEGLAAASAAKGQTERAARLFGSAESLRKTGYAPRPPLSQIAYERDVAAAQAHLDDVTFATAWAEGRVMSLEQAIIYALSKEQLGASGQKTHHVPDQSVQ